METQKVGIREFRDNLSSYLLTAEAPVAITRHGDTVGLYIPTRRKRTEAERQAMWDVWNQVQQSMKEAGVTEEELVADFKRLRGKPVE